MQSNQVSFLLLVLCNQVLSHITCRGDAKVSRGPSSMSKRKAWIHLYLYYLALCMYFFSNSIKCEIQNNFFFTVRFWKRYKDMLDNPETSNSCPWTHVQSVLTFQETDPGMYIFVQSDFFPLQNPIHSTSDKGYLQYNTPMISKDCGTN